jgi:hypothetical protein
MERWARTSPDYPQRRLPIPQLGKANPDTGQYWLWEAGGDQLVNRYLQARAALLQRRRLAIEGG